MMSFEDSFRVNVQRDVAWEALTDIERVYPCLPGAELEEVRDGEFHGRVRLKLGPIVASYSGTARFEKLDPEAGTLVIHAQGRDRHGQGTATARVQASVSEDGTGTLVSMANEIDITGKAAQFGRGVLVDVSKQMMRQFAACLESTVNESTISPSGDSTEVGQSGTAEPEGTQRQVPGGASPVELGSLVKPVVRGRIRSLSESPSQVLVVMALVLLLLILLRRRRW